jgi:hypothetical protein
MISEKVKAIFSESQVMTLIEDYDRTLKLVFEGISTIDKKIDTVRDELKEDIAVLDCKVMGLSKRVDSVEIRLSAEIAEVKSDLAEVKIDLAEVKSDLAEVKSDLATHRNNTELHHTQPKRPLKRA